MIAPRARAAGRERKAPAERRERSEAEERGTAKALADLVAAIGSGEFAARFLAAMRALTGAELCSVFRRDGAGPAALLFAQGDPAQLPDFPLRASRDYAGGFWRSDAQLSRLARRQPSSPVIVRRHASEIADPAYRAACYERAGVTERLSVVWPGFIANGYRTAAAAPFTAEDIHRLELHAGLLFAALTQHVRAGAATGHLFDEAALVERLLGLDCGLSPREAEIAAALILGETQERIAAAKQLSITTIITYRRRAYSKLGVADRRDLAALHRRLVADPGAMAR